LPSSRRKSAGADGPACARSRSCRWWRAF